MGETAFAGLFQASFERNKQNNSNNNKTHKRQESIKRVAPIYYLKCKIFNKKLERHEEKQKV